MSSESKLLGLILTHCLDMSLSLYYSAKSGSQKDHKMTEIFVNV